jgi:hypothetical protein
LRLLFAGSEPPSTLTPNRPRFDARTQFPKEILGLCRPRKTLWENAVNPVPHADQSGLDFERRTAFFLCTTPYPLTPGVTFAEPPENAFSRPFLPSDDAPVLSESAHRNPRKKR